MNYHCLLFDADDTVFEFNSYLGLKKIMDEVGIAFSRDDYDAFQSISKPLWLDYQNGVIDADELAEHRFDAFIHRTPFTGKELNERLQSEMVRLSPPLEGVEQFLKQWHGKVKFGLITNGYASLQDPRLCHTGLIDYFDMVITSESVGVAKPHPRIFQAALEKMADISAQQILMIGDNLVSDIWGGQQVGMATCWFNRHQLTNTSHIVPNFEIHHINELSAIIFQSYLKTA